MASESFRAIFAGVDLWLFMTIPFIDWVPNKRSRRCGVAIFGNQAERASANKFRDLPISKLIAREGPRTSQICTGRPG